MTAVWQFRLMGPAEQQAAVLRLAHSGMGTAEIARLTGLHLKAVALALADKSAQRAALETHG